MGLLPVLSEAAQVYNLPCRIFSMLSMATFLLWGFAFLFALIGLIPALTLMFFRGARRTAGLVWIACICTFIFSVPGIFLSERIRSQEFRKMAIRTKPLIKAIRRFEEEHGCAPAELEDLVPAYIARIPSTGIAAYPEYRYEKLENDSDPWELRVDCGRNILSFDEFYYRPSEKYGKRYGGWVEPMGTWAYFHE